VLWNFAFVVREKEKEGEQGHCGAKKTQNPSEYFFIRHNQ
jgi:hypothetical protein